MQRADLSPIELTAWIERLVAEPASPDGGAWREYEDLAPEQRRALVGALREAVMAAVRSSPPEALRLSDVLERAARGLDELTGPVQRARGTALHFNGRSREALPHFQRALAWHAQRGERLEAARVRRSLVDVHQMSGDSEAALAEAALARPVFEELGERALLAQLECNVGNVHFRLDRYPLARESYQRARALFDQLGDSFGRAHALYNLGNIETNAHAFEPATDSYVQARAAFVEAGHAVLVSDCDYSLGYLDLRRGRFSEAQRALVRAREGYLQGGKPTGVPLCDLDLCELHLRLDAHRDALVHGRRALERFAELGMGYESAKARLMTGIALSKLGRAPEAERELAAAARELDVLGNRTLGALATLHRIPIARERSSAQIMLAEVVAAAEALHASGDELLGQLARLALGEALLCAGRREEGLRELELLASPPAPRRCTEGELANVRIECLRRLAEERLLEGDPRAAGELLRKAVSWIDATLANLTNGDARLSFFSRRQPAFAELAVLLLEERGRAAAEEAIRLVERSRARNLGERAGRSGASPRVRAARERLDILLSEELDRALRQGASDAPRRAAHGRRAELARLQEELLELDRGERGEAPWGSPGTRPELASETGERAGLGRLAEGEALLYFIEARGAFVGVSMRKRAASPGGIELLRIERLAASADRPSVAHQLSRARFFLEKYRLGSAYARRHAGAARRGLERMLGTLGDALLAPFFRTDRPGPPLQAGAPLVVIPYGGLHEVPFAGLRVGGRPLVELADVCVARSLRALDGPAGERLANRRVLSCTDAAADLPALRREQEGLSILGGGSLRRVDAAEFLERCASASPEAIVHIAAHGSFQPDHPLFAGMQLGERFLTAFDVARLSLPGKLILLSGCETGRQALPHGEELYGPEQAFFAAGARAVLSSLWPIADEAGASFVTRAVAGLAAGADARCAVSSAQRELHAAGAPPEEWAGFVLAGDPSASLPLGAELAARRG